MSAICVVLVFALRGKAILRVLDAPPEKRDAFRKQEPCIALGGELHCLTTGSVGVFRKFVILQVR